jgi:hypothetical protein
MSNPQLSIRDNFYYSDIQNPKKYAIEVANEETGKAEFHQIRYIAKALAKHPCNGFSAMRSGL